MARFLNDGKVLSFAKLAALYNFYLGSGIDINMHKVVKALKIGIPSLSIEKVMSRIIVGKSKGWRNRNELLYKSCNQQKKLSQSCNIGWLSNGCTT
jgi:hypothetical protein